MQDVTYSFFIPLMIFAIPVIAMLGAFVYLIVRTTARSRLRELEVRERIAMIERGLVPPPEVDPRGFERAIGRHVTVRPGASLRLRRAGVTIMGVGLGLMLIIGFAGEAPNTAFGIGGAIIVLGLAFYINSLFDGPAAVEPPYRAPFVPSNPASPSAAPAPPERRPD